MSVLNLFCLSLFDLSAESNSGTMALFWEVTCICHESDQIANMVKSVIGSWSPFNYNGQACHCQQPLFIVEIDPSMQVEPKKIQFAAWASCSEQLLHMCVLHSVTVTVLHMCVLAAGSEG